MAKSKQLSNPFSTGGGGAHFEAHVQASFVVLMLTGGFAPCLPCWPIVEIKLQGKIDDFDTDDLIIVVENSGNKEQRKLLGQVKHSIAITESNALFGEVMQAAWNDFTNPKVFRKNNDVIALFTGPLSYSDSHNVQWLLEQARHTKNVDEFFRNVQQAYFSPSKSKEKLQVIQHHLNKANNGNEVSRDELYNFLNHFHLISYDLGNEYGIILSLLYSHISQFQNKHPQLFWSRIVDIVQSWNQDGGTITVDKLPEDLLEGFKQKLLAIMPEEFQVSQEMSRTDWAQQPEATYLALAILIGSWNENYQSDIETITLLLGIGYDSWLQKAREVLHHPNSLISLKNGIWKVVNRAESWNLLGSRILDQNLDTFMSLAVTVLKERDPAFELHSEERYAAKIHEKVLKHSHELRKGIAEGLAILGSLPNACSNCSQEKAEATSVLVIREILSSADWVVWGSLNRYLPALAEAAPNEFLNAVENALRLSTCPFDELFAQESNGITGENYLTGLLWALEGLAWEEQYLVRVCIVLGELASHDPGGQWSNRPSNSLKTILLPWFPQTLASFDKRKVAVQTLIREWPDVAWNLIIQLLPGQHLMSSGSYKPNWRTKIPDDWNKAVTHQVYWQQVSFYAELAIKTAGYYPARLSTLIDLFDRLPKPAFDQLIEILASESISKLPEGQRSMLWDHLKRSISQQRRFGNEKLTMLEERIASLEKIAEVLAPRNLFNLYQHLFANDNFERYEENDDWDEQNKRLGKQQETAIKEIFHRNGLEGVIRFAESVDSPGQVGRSLGWIDHEEVEQSLLPHFLNTMNNKHKALVSNYIWERHQLNGWKWSDNLDKSGWAPAELGHFLACLPFTKNSWDRASMWLEGNQREYWSRTNANAYEADNELAIAIDQLIQYGRPHAAINCLIRMHYAQQPINVDQTVRALIAALSSNEPNYAMNEHHIVKLIKFLQSDYSVDKEDLMKIEWAYLPLLNHLHSASPIHLGLRLADDPVFFCELIQLIYRAKDKHQSARESTEEIKAKATNAWLLLHTWKIPPGSQDKKTFNPELFNAWLQGVKKISDNSGHLEVALIHIGEVLIYTPPDPNGLWIHNTVAAALNDRDAEKMRRGFYTGMLNSRGVHWIDPSGKQEKILAEQFRLKAEDVENVGFQRFAVALRDIAETYEREAKRIVDEHKYLLDD